MENDKAIVQQDTIQNVPQPVGVFNPEEDLARAQRASKALMQVIEITKPLKMNGKTYLYFEHWQTVAQFFGHSVGIDNTVEILKDGKNNGYIAKSLLYNKDGVVVGGAEASCVRDEKSWLSKPDFQLRSMAQTRAMAKALRSRFGFVAVLAGLEATPAEEMDGVKPAQAQPTQASSTPTNVVQGEVVSNSDFTTRPASPAQISYIRKLAEIKGYELTPEKVAGITSKQASDLIGELQSI